MASQSIATVSGARVTAPRRRSVAKSRWYVVAGFMSLFIVGFGVFTLYPMIMVFYYSLTNFKQGSKLPVHFVGLQNYISLFNGSAAGTFGISIKNTLWMVVVLVPAQTIWAMLLAALINAYKRSAKVYRTIFYLPAMAPVVAASLSWIVMLNPTGPVNRALAHLGIHGPLWFGSPAWTKPTLTLMAMWMIGNTMVIFSAALLDVPKSLYEAASIDGAGAIQRFYHVTLPSISPVIYFSVITGVIFTFQYFTQAFVVSTSNNANLQASNRLGYPQNSLFFYTTGIYQQGFNFFKTNTASAMAVLLFFVILLITAIFIRASRSLIYYRGEQG
jgi:multiple sugar transport system permease protein